MNTNLDELINGWREGQLSTAEFRHLSDALATQDGRAALRGDWFLEAALPESLRTSPVLKLAQKMDPQAPTQQAASNRWRGWLGWRPLTAAAAIVLGMAAFWWPQRGVELEVVQISGAVPTAWRAGDKMRLNHLAMARGSVQLRLSSGALLNAAAPVEMKLLDEMHVRLLAGRVTVAVPTAAHGFTVETPAGRVVDLGTRFGVETRAANTVGVHVFEGKVEVETKQKQRVQLTAGDAAVLDPLRGIEARMLANETLFVTAAVPSTSSHMDNPFVGATFYRNVDYTAAVNAAADLQGGALGKQMRQVAAFPTFIWLDSIAAVHGTGGNPRSLAGHLDEALAQGANAIGIVIYNMPNRDGSALASNGELLVAENGLQRYKTEYIDAIFNVLKQSKYSTLRVVMVIEPDSLPNLITNLKFPRVAEAHRTGTYVQGVQYAIGTLRSLDNTYAYIDVAHAGWLGWKNNLKPFAELLKKVGAGLPGGNGMVDGFISNTANYNVFVEPYMKADQKVVKTRQVRSLRGWYDMNDHIEEQSFANALRTALITGSDAYPENVGLLLDTSRNGWGGPNRPTGPSTSTDLREFVRATTLDKRTHKGNWGNQSGAGIGERPLVNPAPNYDAFVWVKPPGQSDGSSSLIPKGPENPEGKGFDRMCDPTYKGNALNGNTRTGALPNAPVAGRWFQAQFVELVRNAFPPFQP